MVKVNGAPISLLQPEILRLKVFEPILLLGAEKFANVCFSIIFFFHIVDFRADIRLTFAFE